MRIQHEPVRIRFSSNGVPVVTAGQGTQTKVLIGLEHAGKTIIIRDYGAAIVDEGALTTFTPRIFDKSAQEFGFTEDLKGAYFGVTVAVSAGVSVSHNLDIPITLDSTGSFYLQFLEIPSGPASFNYLGHYEFCDPRGS